MIFYQIDEKILFIILFSVFIPNAFAATESFTEYGSLQIENDVYEIIRDEQTIIKIWGTIDNLQRETRLNVVFFLPDGLTEGLHALPTSDGYFETFWMLDEESQLGVVTYGSNILGEVSFEVKEKEYSKEELMTAREMLEQIQQSKASKEPVKESESNLETGLSTTSKPVLIEEDPIEIIPTEDEFTLYEQGQEKFDQQKYSEALNIFNQALEYDLFNSKIQNAIENTENKIQLMNKCENKKFDSVDAYDFYNECCNLEKDSKSVTDCRQGLIYAKQEYLKGIEPKIDPLTQLLNDANEILISKSNESIKKLQYETSQSSTEIAPYLIIGVIGIGIIIILKKRNKTEVIGNSEF